MRNSLPIFALAAIAFIIVLLFAIPPTRRWILSRLKRFDYLGDYFSSFHSNLVDIAFGVTVVGVVWAIPFLVWAIVTQFTSLPAWVNWSALLAAFFITGYYMWRALHVRLVPKLEAKRIIAQVAPTNDLANGVINMYLQIVPECLTEAAVVECQGWLLLVSRLDGNGAWVPTQMNSPLKLEWDYYQYAPLTLQPRLGQRLNICRWDNRFSTVIPTVDPLPSKWLGMAGAGPFKFDIRIVSKECPPIDVSVSVNLLGRKWDDPQFVLLQKGQNDDTKYFDFQ